jgi:hypothetical protein
MDAEHTRDATLLHAIHKILLKEWDPLRIRHIPTMRDEYDDYLPNIFKLIQDKSSETEIFDYLWWVEHKVLEKVGRKDHTLRIAALLKSLQKK